MREIVGKAYTELGRELKEAQEKLAGDNQYNGHYTDYLQLTFLGLPSILFLARYKPCLQSHAY